MKIINAGMSQTKSSIDFGKKNPVIERLNRLYQGKPAPRPPLTPLGEFYFSLRKVPIGDEFSLHDLRDSIYVFQRDRTPSVNELHTLLRQNPKFRLVPSRPFITFQRVAK
jgi:hypothetical protein